MANTQSFNFAVSLLIPADFSVLQTKEAIPTPFLYEAGGGPTNQGGIKRVCSVHTGLMDMHTY